MSLESKIEAVQNSLNGKQSRVGSLVVDKLTVNSPINVGSLNLDTLSIKDLNISGTLTTNGLVVNGSALFNNTVNMSGNTSITNLTATNVSIKELRDLTVKGWLKVETTINSGGVITGSSVKNAVWN